MTQTERSRFLIRICVSVDQAVSPLFTWPGWLRQARNSELGSRAKTLQLRSQFVFPKRQTLPHLPVTAAGTQPFTTRSIRQLRHNRQEFMGTTDEFSVLASTVRRAYQAEHGRLYIIVLLHKA